jgi:hypothetical protein
MLVQQLSTTKPKTKENIMKRLISAQIFAFVALFCLVSSVQAYKFAEGTNTRMVEIEKGDTLWGIGSALFKAGMLPKWDLPHDAAVAKFIYSLRSFDRRLWEMTPLQFSSFARNLQPGMKFIIPVKKERQIETKFAELEGNLALTKKMVGDLQAEAATLLETNKALAVALQAETEKSAALRAELDMITAQSAEPDPSSPWKYIAATAVMALFFYVMAFFFYIGASLGRGRIGKSSASYKKKNDAELQHLRTRRDELESQGALLADVAKNIEEDLKIVKSQTQLPYPGTQFRVCPSEKQPPKGLSFSDGGRDT